MAHIDEQWSFRVFHLCSRFLIFCVSVCVSNAECKVNKQTNHSRDSHIVLSTLLLILIWEKYGRNESGFTIYYDYLAFFRSKLLNKHKSWCSQLVKVEWLCECRVKWMRGCRCKEKGFCQQQNTIFEIEGENHITSYISLSCDAQWKCRQPRKNILFYEYELYQFVNKMKRCLLQYLNLSFGIEYDIRWKHLLILIFGEKKIILRCLAKTH